MRIVFVSNSYPPLANGGCGVLAENLVTSLRRKGHRVWALVSEDVGRKTGDRVPDYVYAILQLTSPFTTSPRHSIWRRMCVTWANYQRSIRKLREVKPDVVFLMHLGRMSLGPAYAARDLGIPYLFSLNDNYLAQYSPVGKRKDLRGRLRGLAERWIFPRLTHTGLSMDNAISISEATRDALCSLEVPVQKARAIYQGIPLDRFQFRPKVGPANAKLRLLYVGNLVAYKGVLTLLEAAALLQKRLPGRDVTVTIAGDGPQRADLECRAREHGLADKVRFLGWIDNGSLPTLYHESDILVFPSTWPEPFGLTFLEAMACGTPVVSTATGGNREFLRDQENCLIFKAGDPEALASRIVELITDGSLYAKLSRNAANQVREQFSLERYVDRIEEILQVLASGRKGPNRGAFDE